MSSQFPAVTESGAARRRWPYAAVSVLGSLLLAGCVSFGNDRILNEQSLQQIKPGETTKEQVRALLGEPDYSGRTVMSGHTYEWWSYSLSQSVINPVEYLLVTGLFFNGIGTPDDRRDVHVAMDPDGLVTHVHEQATSYENGGLLTSLDIESRVRSRVGRPNQAGESIAYEDAMAVRPGP